MPVFTTCFGPRTAAAGFAGTTWPVISQSNSMRTAASCCFTPGARMGLLQRLDISGDIERPDRGQRQPAILAPGEELPAGPRVGPARVRVADVGGEEFDVAPGGLLAGVGDQRRHQMAVDRGRERAGLEDGGKMMVGRRHASSLAQISRMIKDVIMREMGAVRAHNLWFITDNIKA